MPNPTEIPEAAREEILARRFHTLHERQFCRVRSDGEEKRWEDMPESYHKRVTSTFGQLLREGSCAIGPGLNFLAEADAPALF